MALINKRNARPHSPNHLLTIFFSNGFKSFIGFVGLHLGPTYSIVDLKKICIEMVRRMKFSISLLIIISKET
jgi:hypothetical protein